MEPAFLGTFRLIMKGTREFFCVPLMPLSHFVAKESEGKIMPTIKGAINWFRDASPDQMRKFAADDTTKQRCFQATAGPRDIMYLPM
eukprot:3473823-Alexandrium_andersonii.AAC.1